MKSLLIIGGSGFFGKSILDAYRRKLLEPWKISQIIIISRNADVLRLENPNLIDDSITLINGNILEIESLPFADYVIHAAASAEANKYIQTPEIEKNNIITGTINFCHLAKKIFKSSKILYVSSGAVYGGTSESGANFSEWDSFLPPYKISINKRAYAEAKRDSEERIKDLGINGLSVSVARCFSFVGKYLPRNSHYAIGNFIQDAMLGIAPSVKNPNPVYRAYMYADELVIWLMTILESAKDTCPTYNVGSDSVVEIHNLAAIIFEVVTGGYIKKKTYPPSYDDYYIPNINKARIELGLEHSIGLEESIRLTYRAILDE